MVDLPAELRSLFAATIQERDDTYVVEIPKREVDNEVLTEGETYRVRFVVHSQEPHNRVKTIATDPCSTGTPLTNRRRRSTKVRFAP